ncbi:5'3'-nucleotidase mitochondrial [Cricetulus griseus]
MLRLRGCCARPRGGAPVRAERSRASSRALRVLVDMDGVLADFEGGFLRKFRARFPDLPFVALEDRRGFWVSEQYGRLQPGLSEKAVSIWESKDFFFELEPLPGAVEAVKQMANLQNTDVFICTSPIKMIKYCPYEKKLHLGPSLWTEVLLPSTGAEPHPSWEHILFTSCHNHHLQLKPPRRRLHSWADDWKAILDSKRPR